MTGDELTPAGRRWLANAQMAVRWFGDADEADVEEWFGGNETDKGCTFEDLETAPPPLCTTCNGTGLVPDGLPSNGPQSCPACGPLP